MFSKYWELMFKKKQMRLILRKDSSKVVHHARLLKKLFSPNREADKLTTDRVYELGSIAVMAIIAELLAQNKASYKYLSISKLEFSQLLDR
jgi:hypothetical protein